MADLKRHAGKSYGIRNRTTLKRASADNVAQPHVCSNIKRDSPGGVGIYRNRKRKGTRKRNELSEEQARKRRNIVIHLKSPARCYILGTVRASKEVPDQYMQGNMEWGYWYSSSPSVKTCFPREADSVMPLPLPVTPT